MLKYDINTFMSNLYEGVYVVDSKRKIIFWNAGCEHITGYKAEEVMNSFCHQNILQHVDQNGKNLCFDGCPLLDTLETGEIREADVFLHHKNGHRVPVSVKSIPIYDENDNVVAAVEAFTDSRYKKDSFHENKKLKKLLEIDSLTSVSNRRFLEINLLNSILENEEFDIDFGVLFLDIDHFKNINDTYGHNIGDEVLKIIAKTVEFNLRPSDILGRWGGEEFIAIIKKVTIDELAHLAERLRVICKNSFYSIDKDTNVSVTVSIGGSLYVSGESLEQLVARADKYMYESKQAGRDKVTIKK